MTGIYLTWLASELRAAGLTVVESDGWQRRARSSGGFPSTPLGVQWHHTASRTAPQNDISWQINGTGNPIGNMTIMRDGSVWLVAAGAANTAGKGGPLRLSRGTVPLDSGNTRTVAIEVANNGVGEAWPQVQIDAYFTASNAINRRLGNLPTDVFSHAIGTGNGWTNRKIDPATAAAVQGPWKPRSVNNSGTWSLDDIRAECSRRAGTAPPPIPNPDPDPDDGDDDMAYPCEGIWTYTGPDAINGGVYAIYSGGYKVWIPNDVALAAKQALLRLRQIDGTVHGQPDRGMFQAFGPVLGPIVQDGTDMYGLPPQ